MKVHLRIGGSKTNAIMDRKRNRVESKEADSSFHDVPMMWKLTFIA
jgi:hypothetical protein